MFYNIIYIILFLTFSLGYADEVWDTTYGKVVYEDEISDVAIWSYDWQGTENYIYVRGLAQVYENRGNYTAIWVQPNAEIRCNQPIALHNGEKSYYWGRLNIQFLDADFPSRWQATWNYCDKTPDVNNGYWEATPITSIDNITEETLTTCDIGYEPIWDQSDAEIKCPQRCHDVGGEWTGHWTTTVWGEESVCNCADVDIYHCYSTGE